MTTTSEQSAPPPPPADSHTPSGLVPKLLSVEIATLDQHGDPGFVHTRGHFYTHSAAARFAITQAQAVTALRAADELAVTVTRQGEGYTDTDVLLVGTTGEIVCALAAIPTYAAGVRGAELTAPQYVQEVVAAVAATRPPLDAEHERIDVLEVQVRSVRPDPLPDSTTVLGEYPVDPARQIAGALVEQLIAAAPGRIEGAVTEIDACKVVLVSHSVELSDSDAAAVDRYEKITRLRANFAALDADADADEVLGVIDEHERLHAHTVRAGGHTAHTDGVRS